MHKYVYKIIYIKIKCIYTHICTLIYVQTVKKKNAADITFKTIMIKIHVVLDSN